MKLGDMHAVDGVPLPQRVMFILWVIVVLLEDQDALETRLEIEADAGKGPLSGSYLFDLH